MSQSVSRAFVLKENPQPTNEIGINSRLDTLQAAILFPKLKALIEYEIDVVNKVACWYTERLKEHVVTPTVISGYISSWTQYTILLQDSKERDAVQARLKAHNIPSMIYYPRSLHQQEAYKHFNLSDALYPNTIFATQRCLSLPMQPYLTDQDIDKIRTVIIDTLNSIGRGSI